MAKALGIVRKMDDLGRVVVPMEVRKVNGWEPGTPLEMLSDENGNLVIRQYGQASDRLEAIEDLLALSYNLDDPEQKARIKKAITCLKGAK